MLHGPILPVLLRLAVPTVTVLLVQTLVSVAETYYVGFLGTDALAGVALVFPVLLLMTMMSNGGIGGGVSSAVARAIGAGRRDDADALVFHAVVLAVAFGLFFTAAALLGGPTLYRALGGSDGALSAALLYSGVVFGGSIPIWIVNLLAAALRGVGNVKVPALVTLISAGVVVVLSPVLILGFGPVPGLAIMGAGLALNLYYVGASAVLLRYMASGRGGVTLKRMPFEARLFRDIMSVGTLSALNTLQANLTIVLVTGAVGLFGVDALAGYGIASRLDHVLIPLIFGLGTAVLTMVGVNIGAGDTARAKRVAWTGALLAGAVTTSVGVVVALFPRAWLGLFSHDPAVLDAGTLYLRTVGPFYGCVGLGMILYFASQGAKRVTLPFFAGTARLLIAAGLGWIVVAHFGGGLTALFITVAAGTAMFGVVNALATASIPWGTGPSLTPAAAKG
ncbi:MAG: MATE family efflux transporter [Rhizobiales bacterium]|nr:MATE family efflux transporter [Hyphomicrobiales bacterium]